MCSFLGNELEAQPSLPPLVVPRFKSWSCKLCQGENVFGVIDNNEQRYSSNEIQETPMLDYISIDLNKLIDLTRDGDGNENNHTPINNEKRKDVEVAINRITEHDLGLQNNINHQVLNTQSLEVCPGPLQEMHTNERGFEGNVISNVELVVSNLKIKDKSSCEVPNEGKHIYEDNQGLEELRRSCTLTREAIMVTEKDNVLEQTIEQFPLEPVFEDNVDSEDTDYSIENDVQDHYPTKYTRRSSKKRKKMRLLKEILRENDELNNTEQIIKETLAPQNQSNNPEDSQTQTSIMDNVGCEEDNKKVTKKGHRGRKRKLPLDENGKPSYEFFKRVDNEVQNIGSDAAEVGDNIIFSRPIQEKTSNYQLIRQGGETDSFGERRFPSTNVISRKGKGVLI
ncbi:hypothetical protein CR513_34552, partial [Mucuna pruriens]